MDKLTSMNVFVRVARSGSFAGGAKDLGISRAMATKHIMQLEGTLGTRLINRTTRSLSLTDVGASYLERCQQVLLDVDEMEAAITHLQTEPRGLLKISAPPAIGATHIARAVAEFLKIHKDLTVEMVLQSHSCLNNWDISPRNKWQCKTETGLKIITVTGRMQTNAAHPIRIAAINSLGIVMLPTYIVGKDIENGTLKVILEDYPLPPLDIHAVYPHRKYLSAKVKAFMDFLQVWLEHRVSMHGTE